MPEFNRMTIVAATEVVFAFNSHNDIEPHLVQWDLSERCNASSKTGRAAALAKIAIEENPQVYTENGKASLSEAIVDLAITAPPNVRRTPDWRKLVAGLKLDGFEISGLGEAVVRTRPSWMDSDEPKEPEPIVLRRMLPNDLPGLDMREAENEVDHLLDKHGFDVPKGHLKRAISAFQRGDWSSSNAELRNIHEGLLNDIADRLGYVGRSDALACRNYLGGLNPPFLLSEYNEWDSNTQKPQYVQGLMSRMHTHGSHPGLSEEEDATFRMQIGLITMRLFLRRYDERVVAR